MKIRAAFCLTVLTALALASVALANTLTMPAQSLGQIEGTLKFCSSVNPKAEAKYKEFGKMMVKDATDDELKNVRASSEYKDAYDSITEQLGKVPKNKAVESCTAFLGKH
jgi:hypothetical protein